MTLARLVENVDPSAMPLAHVGQANKSTRMVSVPFTMYLGDHQEQLEDRPTRGSTTAVRSDDDKFGVVIVAAPKTLAMFHKTIETLCKKIVGYVDRESHGVRWGYRCFDQGMSAVKPSLTILARSAVLRTCVATGLGDPENRDTSKFFGSVKKIDEKIAR
ncbi:hypothetical protein BKA70DRAFT_1445243 [Coprinopsis sp. MPI-PUGE-AT-0042]|nr:hypothetical protein BKA70DRAFT_1445243 [Coprinopsis sp. MPI-PUGE-AT-0042]